MSEHAGMAWASRTADDPCLGCGKSPAEFIDGRCGPCAARDLLAHAAELEKSLENARKERDHALRRTEIVEQETRVKTFALGVDLEAARKERDAAVADNAALLRALHGSRSAHARGCRESGVTGQTVRPCPCGLDVLLASPHPGAELLERMKRLRAFAEDLGEEDRAALLAILEGT